MRTFTVAEKREAIERELGFRRSVYPNLVERGRMSIEEAERQIALFEAILVDYPDPQGSLWGEMWSKPFDWTMVRK